MDETTQAFFQALNNTVWPENKPRLYRLYHDDSGRPLFYSQEDLPGKYIDVTPDQYLQGRLDVVISGNEIHRIKKKTVRKLVKSDSGACCHPADITIITAPNQSHTKWKLEDDR